MGKTIINVIRMMLGRCQAENIYDWCCRLIKNYEWESLTSQYTHLKNEPIDGHFLLLLSSNKLNKRAFSNSSVFFPIFLFGGELN